MGVVHLHRLVVVVLVHLHPRVWPIHHGFPFLVMRLASHHVSLEHVPVGSLGRVVTKNSPENDGKKMASHGCLCVRSMLEDTVFSFGKGLATRNADQTIDSFLKMDSHSIWNKPKSWMTNSRQFP